MCTTAHMSANNWFYFWDASHTHTHIDQCAAWMEWIAYWHALELGAHLCIDDRCFNTSVWTERGENLDYFPCKKIPIFTPIMWNKKFGQSGPAIHFKCQTKTYQMFSTFPFQPNNVGEIVIAHTAQEATRRIIAREPLFFHIRFPFPRGPIPRLVSINYHNNLVCSGPEGKSIAFPNKISGSSIKLQSLIRMDLLWFTVVPQIGQIHSRWWAASNWSMWWAHTQHSSQPP